MLGYKILLEESVKELQVILKAYGINVLIPEKLNRLDSNLEDDINLGNNFNGKIYKQQITTFGKVISHLFKNGEYVPNYVPVAAVTQCGKTGTINLLSLLTVIIYLITGKYTLFVKLLINDLALEIQANDEATNFRKIFGCLIFTYKGKTVTFCNVLDSIDKRLDLEENRSICGYTYRTTKNSVDEVKSFKDMVQKNGMELVVAIDESHARFDKDSNLHNMVLSSMQSRKEKKYFSVIFLSGSNYAISKWAEKENYPIVIMDINEKIMTCSPWLYQNKLNVTEPTVESIYSFSLKRNIFIPRGKIRGIVKSKIKHNRFLNSLNKLINYLLLENNIYKGNGILLRIINNNKETKILMEEIKNINPEIVFGFHNSNACKNSTTLKRYVDNIAGTIDDRKPYVIFLTGKGRMGEVAPSDAKYQIDFSAKSNLQALIQGMRVCGPNKGKVLFLCSKYNCDLLNNHFRTGEFEKPPNKHLKIDRNPSPFKEIIINRESNLLSDKIQSEINEISQIENNKVKRTKTGYCFPYGILQNLINDKDCLYSENNGNVKIAIRSSDNEEEKGRINSGERQNEPYFVLGANGQWEYLGYYIRNVNRGVNKMTLHKSHAFSN